MELQPIPICFSTDTMSQLDVPWLYCVSFGMDGEQVSILHHAHQIMFSRLMKGIYSSLGPTGQYAVSPSAFVNCGVDHRLILPSPPLAHANVLHQPKKIW